MFVNRGSALIILKRCISSVGGLSMNRNIQRTGHGMKRRCGRRTLSLQKAGITVFLIFLAVLALSMVFVVRRVNARAESENSFKYYKSIQVEKGDTLWDLAERQTAGGSAQATADYIQEVRDLNHLDGSEIHYGEYLVIPYYSAEKK